VDGLSSPWVEGLSSPSSAGGEAWAWAEAVAGMDALGTGALAVRPMATTRFASAVRVVPGALPEAGRAFGSA
jgi:hypothetical protein